MAVTFSEDINVGDANAEFIMTPSTQKVVMNIQDKYHDVMDITMTEQDMERMIVSMQAALFRARRARS